MDKMEVIRSKAAIPHDTTAAGCKKFLNDLADSFSWHDTDEDGEGNVIKLYITDNSYLEYTDTDSDGKGNVIRLYDTTAWNGGYVDVVTLNSNYINFQIFKVNEHCAAFAFKADSGAMTEWSGLPVLAIDTHGGNDMMAVQGTDGTSVRVSDGASGNQLQPWGYKGSDSLNSNYTVTQVAPFVVPRSGYIADNISTVLFSPVGSSSSSTGQFISLDVNSAAKLYYFSRGLAMPCGNGVTYTQLT